MDCRNELSKWIVEVDCRSGLSKWIVEVDCRSGLSKWIVEVDCQNIVKCMLQCIPNKTATRFM